MFPVAFICHSRLTLKKNPVERMQLQVRNKECPVRFELDSRLSQRLESQELQNYCR